MAAPCTSYPAPSLTRFQYLVTSSSNVAHISTNRRKDQALALALAEKPPWCWQRAKHSAQAWARDSLTADTTVSSALAATSAGLQLLESGPRGETAFFFFLGFFSDDRGEARPRRGGSRPTGGAADGGRSEEVCPRSLPVARPAALTCSGEAAMAAAWEEIRRLAADFQRAQFAEVAHRWAGRRRYPLRPPKPTARRCGPPAGAPSPRRRPSLPSPPTAPGSGVPRTPALWGPGGVQPGAAPPQSPFDWRWPLCQRLWAPKGR